MSQRVAHELGTRDGAREPPSRRVPAQQRSRERVERICAAAARLIAEKGSDQLRMTEIAALADMSIGSLYQYFPDKAAIIRSLAERYHAESRRCVEAALAPVTTLAELRGAFSALLDRYRDLFLSEPVRRDVWSAMQADKQLMALELAESRACGAILAVAMRRAHPGADAARVEATSFLLWQLGEATMRLALSLDRAEGDAVAGAFKRMALAQVSEP